MFVACNPKTCLDWWKQNLNPFSWVSYCLYLSLVVIKFALLKFLTCVIVIYSIVFAQYWLWPFSTSLFSCNCNVLIPWTLLYLLVNDSSFAIKHRFVGKELYFTNYSSTLSNHRFSQFSTDRGTAPPCYYDCFVFVFVFLFFVFLFFSISIGIQLKEPCVDGARLAMKAAA